MSPGTRLDEFEIVRVLGTGGFGIVYLARDHVLQRDVAIKEYMPAALAGRGHGVTVSLRSAGFAETFAKGLESFLSEARLLAGFDHRSLVKVHRFWRSNATAYMAMQYYSGGQTLKDARLHMSGAPDEAWLDAFIQALLGVLELLHGEGVFHRDISPDNILLLQDGRPVLLDFGSARRVVANSPQCFTAYLKPQFAPLEQYANEAGGMRQGPWTDLYALGATLYFVLTGQAPTPSVVRAVRDVLPTLSSHAESTLRGIPPRLLATIDWALALAPEQRPQSVLSVRRALRGEIAPPPPTRRHLGAAAADIAPDPGASARRWARAVSAPVTLATWVSRSRGAGAEPSPSPRIRFGAVAALAFMGVAAIAWGAWRLDQPAPLPRGAAALPVQTAVATTRLVATATSAPSPMLSTSADPVALEVRQEALQTASAEPAGVPEAAALTRSRTAAARTVAPATWKAPRDLHRNARAKVRSATAPVKAPLRAEKTACDGRGLLERAWCAIHPCKAQRSRSSPECMDRLRAEAARQQRIERQ